MRRQVPRVLSDRDGQTDVGDGRAIILHRVPEQSDLVLLDVSRR